MCEKQRVFQNWCLWLTLAFVMRSSLYIFLLCLAWMGDFLYLQTKTVGKWIIFSWKWHSWPWYYTGYYVNELIYTDFDVFRFNWKEIDRMEWFNFLTRVKNGHEFSSPFPFPRPPYFKSVQNENGAAYNTHSAYTWLSDPFAIENVHNNNTYSIISMPLCLVAAICFRLCISTHFPFQFYIYVCIQLCIADEIRVLFAFNWKMVRPVALFYSHSFSFLFIEFKSKWRTNERHSGHFMPSLEMLSSIKKRVPH